MVGASNDASSHRTGASIAKGSSYRWQPFACRGRGRSVAPGRFTARGTAATDTEDAGELSAVEQIRSAVGSSRHPQANIEAARQFLSADPFTKSAEARGVEVRTISAESRNSATSMRSAQARIIY